MSPPDPSQVGCLWACAQGLMRACVALMPSEYAQWAQAMAAELGAANSAPAACRFALGCLGLALKLHLRFRLQALGRLFSHAAAAGQALQGMSSSVAGLGSACACVAVLAGGVFMASAGAPPAWPWMNGLSLAFALLSLALLPGQRLQTDARLRARLCVLLGAALLASTLLEPSAGLSGRWLRLGAVSVHPVWLLLPSLLLLSVGAHKEAARNDAGGASLGLLLAILALIVQAELSWLLLVSGVLLLRRLRQPNRRQTSWLACLALLGVGMASPIWQAPISQPFVDQVLTHGGAQGAGLAWFMLFPAALLLVLLPAWRHPQALEHGLLWSGILLLSLPGWLPTPLLGMGGSAILSYVLSLAAVPGPGQSQAAQGAASAQKSRGEQKRLLRLH